jgi:hypothetical protein
VTRIRPPVVLGSRGRRLWRQIVADFDLSDAERAVLVEACRTADLVDRLASRLGDEDLTVEGSRGQVVINPLVAELRQQRELLGRLLARLALPDDADAEDAAVRLGRRGAHARWYGRPKAVG